MSSAVQSMVIGCCRPSNTSYLESNCLFECSQAAGGTACGNGRTPSIMKFVQIAVFLLQVEVGSIGQGSDGEKESDEAEKKNDQITHDTHLRRGQKRQS